MKKLAQRKSCQALVFQSGGCTAVINQSLAGIIEGVRRSRKIDSLWGAHYGIDGVVKGRWTRLTPFSQKHLDRLKQSPSAGLGSCRLKLSPAQLHQAIQRLQKKQISIVFAIGGNDSAQTGLMLLKEAKRQRYPLQVICVPKTIDNDLMEMDYTPGYGSVARFMAVTTQEAALDTRAMQHVDPIKIIETMGRNSGWIVAASALGRHKKSDPPHLLYFPEVAFSEKRFVNDVKKMYRKNGYCVIVLSETIRDKKGNRIGRKKEWVKKDAFGHAYVEGTAQYLAGVLEKALKVRVRFDKPGTIQRMAMGYISTMDQRMAFGSGKAAVALAEKGHSGVMVAIVKRQGAKDKVQYRPVPIQKIVNRERKLPVRFLSKQGHDITPAFMRYAQPLIGQKPNYTFLAS